MARFPSIRSIAKQAGVSTATVSLALRNHSKIRPIERQRIQRIAAEAGYKTNALVATLMAQLRSGKTTARQSTIGLLYIGKEPQLFELSPTFRAWIEGCEAQAASRGYGIDRFSLSDFEPVQVERLIKILHARNITGLVVVGPSNNIVARNLDAVWKRSATAVIGIRAIRPPLASASNDQFSTAALALDQLRRLGYRRSGLCIASHINHSVEERFSGGFFVAQNKLPPEDRIPVFSFELDAEKFFQKWFLKYRPDSIATLHGEILLWIESLGLGVPKDIGLLHLDWRPDMPEWAGMQQNNEYVGRAAIDLIIGQLNRNELGIPRLQRCMNISSTWMPGSTVRDQRAGTPSPSTPRQRKRAAR